MNNEQQWGDRGEWYVVVQFILFGIIFLIPFLGPPLGRWPGPWDVGGVVVGLVLGGIGLLFAAAGLIHLGRNLTAVPHPKEDAQFVDGGIYGLVRHPIYFGIISATFGWGLIMNNVLVLLMGFVLFLFFDLKTRREEKWLAVKFTEYREYQRQVRKLIPLIY